MANLLELNTIYGMQHCLAYLQWNSHLPKNDVFGSPMHVKPAISHKQNTLAHKNPKCINWLRKNWRLMQAWPLLRLAVANNGRAYRMEPYWLVIELR